MPITSDRDCATLGLTSYCPLRRRGPDRPLAPGLGVAHGQPTEIPAATALGRNGWDGWDGWDGRPSP